MVGLGRNPLGNVKLEEVEEWRWDRGGMNANWRGGGRRKGEEQR